MAESLNPTENPFQFSAQKLGELELEMFQNFVVLNIPETRKLDCQIYQEQFKLTPEKALDAVDFYRESENSSYPLRDQAQMLYYFHEIVSQGSSLNYDPRRVTEVEMNARLALKKHNKKESVALMCQKFGLMYGIEPERLRTAMTVRLEAYDRFYSFNNLDFTDTRWKDFEAGLVSYYSQLLDAIQVTRNEQAVT